jgi:hypothetical protein
MAPQIGTGGFDFICTNATPRRLIALGKAPNQATYLRLQPLVSLANG